MRTLTHKQWMYLGRRKFGQDYAQWKFVCPSCGHICSVQDYLDAGAPQSAIGISCIGRYLGNMAEADKNTFKGKGGPCAYAGYGLFCIAPIRVMQNGQEIRAFDFAPVPRKRKKTHLGQTS